MALWEKKLPGCFAGMNAPFGVHPNDHKRAVDMLRLALREGATFDAVIREAKRWLRQQNVTKEGIESQAELIRRFHPNPFQKRKLGSAWLITWEGTSPPKSQRERIVSILGYRVSSDRVLECVEQIYVDRLYSLHEKMSYARHRADNAFPAEYHRVGGISWGGRITCGHDPQLLARPVKNLTLSEGSRGEDVLSWDEIPIPTALPRTPNSA